ncbi:hypothetical protein K450DRAFT_220025 [Umbelopsis ramanniana AG]|uniref:SLC41A/MgtE integral membrane domain-containing protein n=1 Tax=Umbelopsis ramanniana AG TaxID=1314678 RepID=A0AAD5EH96_UMBRA|nr:uncharacterized protein K450DRAFT_220025 [Umbelopsis ramanniana AG]KAI8583798.1 hypothetical protein K450DRAFT_220025 [Umbelopsis ramanniana AG]
MISNPVFFFLTKALPSVLVSIAGLIAAGELLDIYLHWDVFIHIPELFILVPVLLNLKGNLEMNLAARLSTSANLGDLDNPASRRRLVIGNLALLQVQSLIAGCIAGLFSFILGILIRPSNDASTYYESMLVISSSMLAASLSSLILGIFMCILIILSRRFNVDPDNIACPMASSLGDIVTLVILATFARLLKENMESILSTVLVIVMVVLLPGAAALVWTNRSVKQLLFTGWTPIMCAMVISSLSGVVFENFVDSYKGLALLIPVLNGLTGNIGSIYASRISTALHGNRQESYKKVEQTLLLMNIPVAIILIFVIWGFDLGEFPVNAWFLSAYFIVSMACAWLALKLAKSMTLASWKWGRDPDNTVLPFLTATIDVISTAMLVITFVLFTMAGFEGYKTSTQS